MKRGAGGGDRVDSEWEREEVVREEECEQGSGFKRGVFVETSWGGGEAKRGRRLKRRAGGEERVDGQGERGEVAREECEQGSGLKRGCSWSRVVLWPDHDRSGKAARALSFRASSTASPSASQTASWTASRRQLRPLASVTAVHTAFPTMVPTVKGGEGWGDIHWGTQPLEGVRRHEGDRGGER